MGIYLLETLHGSSLPKDKNDPFIDKRKNFVKSEWEFFEYYDNINKEYLKTNYKRYLKDIFLKIKFIFFNVKRDGSLDKNQKNGSIVFSHFISKIFFNLAIIVLIYNIITIFITKKKELRSILEEKIFKKHIYFLIFLILLMPPHIIAWATSKHLVGITSVSIIYIYCYFSELYSYKN